MFFVGLIIFVMLCVGVALYFLRKDTGPSLGHRQLITLLIDQNDIKSENVKNSMLKVDRADFAPKDPYIDKPQSIGYNATISAPHMHAKALELLSNHLVVGNKALDVGCGSGYLTAAMAYMVGNTGKVIGIEHMEPLYFGAKANINNHHSSLLKNKVIEIHHGDGRKGYPPEAPYDAIHVGAAANDSDVQNLLKQLKNGGKMVIPVKTDDGQKFRAYTKDSDGNVSQEDIIGVKYVHLTSAKDQLSDN